MPTFDAAEVRDFEQSSRHMTRAMQMAVRLDCLEGAALGLAGFDAMPQPLALVDERLSLLHANPAMESLLRRREGLMLRAGTLVASPPTLAQELTRRVILASRMADEGSTDACPLWLPTADHRFRAMRVLPVAAPGQGRYPSPPGRAALLMLGEEPAGRPVAETLRKLHGLTHAEARLAVALADGRPLRAAASEVGISYQSARVRLKTVFGKLEVHTQAQLAIRLVGLRQ